jgi:hypothetical protein
MIEIKKYFVIDSNKILRTNDQIDPVTSLLYHEGSKIQEELIHKCQYYEN